MGKISMVIPTKDKIELITNLIHSLISHNTYWDLDVLIADTGSSLENLEKLQSLVDAFNTVAPPTAKAQVIQYDYYNFSKINNDVVLNHTSEDTKYILLSNNDIILKTDAIRQLVEMLENLQSSCTAKIATIGPKLLYPNNCIQHWGQKLYFYFTKGKDKKTANSSFGHFGDGAEDTDNFYDICNKETDIYVGNTFAFVLMEKSFFIKQNMLNEDFAEAFQDVDFNLRTTMSGYHHFTYKDAVCYHMTSATRDPSKGADIDLSILNHTLLDYIQYLKKTILL